MYKLIVIFILITCVLLALVVLIQNSKGGGLATNFAPQNRIVGARDEGNILEKATWILAVVLVVLSLTASIAIPRGNASESESGLKTELSTEDMNVSVNAIPMQQNQPAEQVAE